MERTNCLCSVVDLKSLSGFSGALAELTGHPIGDMCNTPTYCDLGKPAKDVFSKGYGFGMVKIDLRTKLCSGVEFSTFGHAYTVTGKASGNLETKYKICNYGLTFTQKWNTDNTLGTEISLESKLKLNSSSFNSTHKFNSRVETDS